MKKKSIWALAIVFSLLLCACSGGGISSLKDKVSSEDEDGDGTGGTRTTATEFIMPEASGTVVYGQDTIIVDASNTA